jgi:hypothetical protein
VPAWSGTYALGSKRMYGCPRSRKVFLEWLVA